ncbi:MAG TPA: hypothetical protein PK392_11905, partial [Opitutaceae bacterium]|nr:hypothetical protein [Opitutaceae bacterium]
LVRFDSRRFFATTGAGESAGALPLFDVPRRLTFAGAGACIGDDGSGAIRSAGGTAKVELCCNTQPGRPGTHAARVRTQ